MAKSKKKVHADQFIADVRAGMSDAELMEKFDLSSNQLQNLIEKLLDSGKLVAADLEEKPRMESTIELASTCRHCGALKLVDSGTCPHCGRPAFGSLSEEEHEASKAAGPEEDKVAEKPKKKKVATPPPAPETVSLSTEESASPFLLELEKEDFAESSASVAAPPPAPRPRANRKQTVILAATIGFLVLTLLGAAGWYTGVISLPIDSGPDVPAVSEPAKPSPAMVARTKAKAAQNSRPAEPEGGKKSPPGKVAQTTQPSAPHTASPADQEKARGDGPAPAAAKPAPFVHASPAESKPSEDLQKAQGQSPAPAPPETPSQILRKVSEGTSLTALAAAGPAAASGSPGHMGFATGTAQGPKVEEPTPEIPAGAGGMEKPQTVSAPAEREEGKKVGTRQKPTNLISAVRRGDLEAAGALLDKGADVNGKDEDGVTACMLASAQGNFEILEFLLKKGAHTELKDSEGSSALSLALESGNAKCIKLLLAHDRNAGAAELLDAAKKGRKDVVKLLLENGADANSGDREGNTLLMLAAGTADLALVKILLGRGADVNARNSRGLTALAWAYSSPSAESVPVRVRREVVRLLKQQGGLSGASGSGE